MKPEMQNTGQCLELNLSQFCLSSFTGFYITVTQPLGNFCFFFYSFHPYLFFNQDHTTLTFLGFNVDANGNLYDPDTNNIIKRSIMNNNLYQDLNRQMQRDYMTLSTNYALLSRYVFYDGIYF